MPEPGRLHAVLLGTAVGDSVGLPAEKLSRARIERLGWTGDWRQRFLFGRGLCSDDTEHSLMVLQSMLEAEGEVERFRRRFARRLRWWVLGIPAGTGLATLRAGVRLWFRRDPDQSGVASAGNGPAMRSAIIGVFYADDPVRRAAYVEASARVTHTDPRAIVGASAIAELAANPGVGGGEALAVLRGIRAADEEWLGLVDQIEACLHERCEVEQFARRIGAADGVSGYVYHTVPVAIYAWLRHPSSARVAISAALDCGGDADTVGAIVGALCGASLGGEALPGDWVRGIVDWPRGLRFIDRLARSTERVPKAFWGFVLMRNLLFLILVLGHGVLRYVPGGLRCLR